MLEESWPFKMRISRAGDKLYLMPSQVAVIFEDMRDVEEETFETAPERVSASQNNLEHLFWPTSPHLTFPVKRMPSISVAESSKDLLHFVKR
jgi:hypothetical protein